MERQEECGGHGNNDDFLCFHLLAAGITLIAPFETLASERDQ
jgi:hypothetical protein